MSPTSLNTDQYLFAQVENVENEELCRFSFPFSVSTNDVLSLDNNMAYNVCLRKAFLPVSFYNLNDCHFSINSAGKSLKLSLPPNISVKDRAALTKQMKHLLDMQEIEEFLNVPSPPFKITAQSGIYTLTCQVPAEIGIYSIELSPKLAKILGFKHTIFNCTETKSFVSDFTSNPLAGSERVIVCSNLCNPSRFNNTYMPVLQITSLEHTRAEYSHVHEYNFPDPLCIPLADVTVLNSFNIYLLDESMNILRCDPLIMKSILFCVEIKRDLTSVC